MDRDAACEQLKARLLQSILMRESGVMMMPDGIWWMLQRPSHISEELVWENEIGLLDRLPSYADGRPMGPDMLVAYESTERHLLRILIDEADDWVLSRYRE